MFLQVSVILFTGWWEDYPAPLARKVEYQKFKNIYLMAVEMVTL